MFIINKSRSNVLNKQHLKNALYLQLNQSTSKQNKIQNLKAT